jgi:NTE family protein
MKVIIGSGGGAWGSYSVGFFTALKKDYDVIIGISTFALMSVLLILKKYTKLKEAYTSVSQKDIFSYNPFDKNGNISTWKSLWRLILNKKTLGESYNLRKLIDKFLTKEDWDELQASGKEVIVACQRISGNCSIEYFSSKTTSFEDFKDAMWISANAPFMTTLVEKNGVQYVDGGLTELVSFEKALSLEPKEIDVFIHRTQDKYFKMRVKDFFHSVNRMVELMRRKIESIDLALSLELCKELNIKTNVYYLPYKLSDNSLMFNKEEMLDFWELGYRMGKEELENE